MFWRQIHFITKILWIFWLPAQSLAEDKNHVLQVAIAIPTMYEADVRDAQATIKVFGDLLIKKNNTSYTVHNAEIYRNIDELRILFEKHDLDVISMTPDIYLEPDIARKMDPVLVNSRNGSHFDKFCLLSDRRLEIGNLNDMKGMRLLLDNAQRNVIAMSWLELKLLNAGLSKSERFFSTINETDKTQKSIMDLFFHRTDVSLTSIGAYETMVALNPQISKEVKIVLTSEPYMFSIICLGHNIGENDRKILMDVMLNLHKDATGQQIVKLFGIERLIPFEASYLTTIRHLMDEYHRVSGRAK